MSKAGVSVRNEDRRRRCKWSADRILEALKMFEENPKSYEQYKHEKFGGLSAALKRLGGIVAASELFGVKYHTFVARNEITKFKLKTVTKTEGDTLIKVYIKENKNDLRLKTLKRNTEMFWLESIASKFYGSWSAALKAFGVVPFQENENIAQKIKKYYQEGQSGKEISERIGISQTTVFKVLRLNGVDTRTALPNYIEKETCLEIVRNLVKNTMTEKRINTDEFKKRCGDIELQSIRHHFGTLSNAVTESGVYTLDIRVPRKLSEEYMLDQIRLGHALGKPLNPNYIGQSSPGTISFARKRFGSWERALEIAGVPTNYVDSDIAKYQLAGHRFEEVLGRILSDLGYVYSKYTHERWQPDFVIGDEWIDAKLSKTTIGSPEKNEQIKNYEGCCKKLTLVYLRGDKKFDRMVTSKTRLMSVYVLLSKLPDCRRHSYIVELNEIELGLRENSNVIGERSNGTSRTNCANNSDASDDIVTQEAM